MMSAKMATVGLLKMKVFENKDYNVIVSVYDVINKILSPYSNYIVDAVMWPNFGYSAISIKEVIITLIWYDLTRRTTFFEGSSWFKVNYLGLVLDMALKFYATVGKGLKLKARKCWGLIPTFVEVTG